MHQNGEKKSLGEIAVFCKGKGLPKSAITHEGRNLCIHYGELFTKYTEVINTVKSRTDLNDGCLFSAENDVLMPTSDVTPNGLAKACWIKSKGVILGGDILVIRPDRQTVNGEFLARLIRNLEQKVLQLVSGSTVFHLYASSIDKLALLIPVHIEQQKIADCLSSIDDLITAQAQKIESLKDHKKGLMQQLFPAEGETVPKLRFPEFLGMGKWEEKILGCVSDVRDGTHDSPKFYRKGRLLITSKNLLPNGELDLVNANLISEQDYKQINKRSKVDIGDIIFGMIGTIGNPVRVRTEGYAIKNVALVKQKKELLNSYLVQFLNSEYIAREFSILNSGNSQKFISLGKIRSLSFPTPPITEQQKIADCLSSIDDLITAQAKKIELLKDHKKGLMQQLFPTADEVEQWVIPMNLTA